MRPRLLSAVVLVLLTGGIGAGGYALGKNTVATPDEARVAHGQAASRAEGEALIRAHRHGIRRGTNAGARRGRRTGARRGSLAGSAAGGAAAQREANVTAAPTVAATAAPTVAARPSLPKQEQGLIPCGLGGGMCTPAEKQARIDGENYCGSFDPSRVNPDGTYTPKPGC